MALLRGQIRRVSPKFFAQPEQVFDDERQAHFDAQKEQTEKMTEVAAQGMAAKIAPIAGRCATWH